MSDGVVYIISITLLIALAGLAFWIAKQSFGFGFNGMSFFQNKLRRRLGVVEAASVDGRRRLILVRRDNVEHLIMTGGPVDVVIETGIDAPAQDMNGLDEPITRLENGLGDGRQSFDREDQPLIVHRDQAN